MKEHTLWKEEAGWSNPVRSQPVRPYLGDLIFPKDPRSADAQEAREILKRFYCNDREEFDSNTDALNAFIASPDEQLFIIEGEVGVGKTWFVRYHLTVEPHSDDPPLYGFGVIDLLYAAPGEAAESVYKQVCPVLEQYFSTFIGGTREALERYAEGLIRSKDGDDEPDKSSPASHAGAAARVENWLEMNYTKEYAEDILLPALESLDGPKLFIAIDNIDRATDEEQGELVQMTRQILRNTKIRLILPVRRSERLLRDRFEGLHVVRHETMMLSPLNHKSMLKMRFQRSKDGADLAIEPIIRDGNGSRTYKYPRLFDKMFSGEAGPLILNISGKDCRVALLVTKRLLESDHLRGLEHIGNPNHAIASLMLGKDYLPDDGAPILNLFDNDEPNAPGNALIRYRVLEYLKKVRRTDPAHHDFIQYFNRLEYSAERVQQVLVRFLMTSVIQSARGHTPERFATAAQDKIGTVVIADLGDAYFNLLLKKVWYYVAAKRGMIPKMPGRLVSYDEDVQRYFVYHTDFVEYLKEEEKSERARIRQWDRSHGKPGQDTHRMAPSDLAHTVLCEKKETPDG